MSEPKKIPLAWGWAKLGDICDTTSGGTPSRKESKYYGGSIYWVKSGELEHNIITDTEEKITEEAIKNSSAKIFPKGTMLIALYGATIGKLAFLGVAAATNQAVCGIYENKYINSKLLFNYLFFKRQGLVQKSIGGAQPNISQSILKDLQIPFPPLREQHRIVAKIEELFSELDKGVEALKTAQQQLKVYRQAVLQWAFEGKLTEEWRKQQKDLPTAEVLLKQIRYGKEKASDARGKKIKPLIPITKEEMAKLPNLPKEWCWVKLGDHAFVTKLAGFEFTKYVKYKDEGDIPVIRAQNVSKDRFVPRNFLYVDREIMENLPRSRVYGGEILMVFVGAGLGNVGIVPEKQEYFLGPNVAKIALENQFLNKYTFHFLCSLLGFANVTGMTKATAQGSISMGNIREVSVPLITLEEQEQIVQEIETRLSVADKLEETITQSLQQAEALRQSILKKAFAGQLVPQDPNDEPAAKLLECIKAERATPAPAQKTRKKKATL